MARKVYVGAPKTEVVTSDNISEWFTLSDADGISLWNGTTLSVTGVSGNERVKFTALQDMTVSFDYDMDSFCKISFTGKYICDEGDSGSYTATLAKGKYFYLSISSAISQQTSTFSNITCTSTNAVARKVKQMYVGVSDKARRVKKAYVGIGGVARPFWGDYKLEYYGMVTPLSVARALMASTSVGDYALFGGGNSLSYISSGTRYSTVDAYNRNLTKTTPTALSEARARLSATSVGNYALFGGGHSSVQSAVVDAYDTSLTRSVPTGLSGGAYSLSATTVGNYAIFAGGMVSMGAVDYRGAYNTSLTRSIPTALSVTRSELSATSVGNYALFGGGANNSTLYTTVDAYNTSLTRSTPTSLSVARKNLASTTVGKYALFGSGGNATDSTFYTTIDAYNESLTRSNPTAMSVGRAYLTATTLGNFAIFAGGSVDGVWIGSNVVDAYDVSLTKIETQNLTTERGLMSATTIGNYALFGGGYDNTGQTNNDATSVVESYTLV